MITVQRLTKDYGTAVAVKGLSFGANSGEVLGFLGPNGAGKTTTLRMLAGALAPTSGRIEIAGFDLAEEPLRARGALGYMPEAAPLYPELRVFEYLMFRAALKGVVRTQRGAKVERALARAKVSDMASVTIGHLSKGYRQRVALADALVAEPPLLILDEPTAGLDPNQIRETRQLIRELKGEHTILISSHILSEIEELCDRALVIHQGQIVAQGTMAALRGLVNTATVVLRVRDAGGAAQALCSQVHGVREVTSEVDRSHKQVSNLMVRLESGADSTAVCEVLIARLVGGGIGVLTAVPQSTRLEETFAELTRDVAGVEAQESGSS